MVTHPGTNWAWRRLTSLIKTNVLLLRHTATEDIFESVDNQNNIGFITDAHFYQYFILAIKP